MKVTYVGWRWLYGAVLSALLLGAAMADSRVEPAGFIAEDTPWETPYYVVDSGIEGPTVLITGGVHGNEPAGFRAAEQIRHWPIVRGKLVIVPLANVPGLRKDTRYLPGVDEDLKDLNRNFPKGLKTTEVPRGELALALWSLVRETAPDWMLDLHEGTDFNISHQPKKGKKRSVGSSIIHFENERTTPIVTEMLAVVNATVEREDRKYVPLKRGPISGSLARAAALVLPECEGMILETTIRDQPISLRSRQHRMMVNSFLKQQEMIAQDCVDLLAGPQQEGLVRVAFFDGPGTGPAGKDNVPRILDEAPDTEIHYVGPEDLRPEVLQQFEVVFFPGGSGSKQAGAIGKNSQHLRSFVEQGGGYIGVCAGAYLCSAHYSWSLDLVDSSVFTGAREIEGVGKKQMWYRGKATDVEVELTPEGASIFRSVPERFEVRYSNGPIISPADHPELDDYLPLAYYRSEKVLYEPQRGTMVDTPAIVSGNFGEGRVISISPHPETVAALESIIADSVRWVAETQDPAEALALPK